MAPKAMPVASSDLGIGPRRRAPEQTRRGYTSVFSIAGHTLCLEFTGSRRQSCANRLQWLNRQCAVLPALRLGLIACCALLPLRASQALVVGSTPNVVPNTTTAPADNPGWNNVATLGNYVYLGDGWVLSARHVGYNATAGIEFQTPGGPATFFIIPGSHYFDYGFEWTNGHHYAVSNPATIQSEGGQTLTLSPFTDLQLFRINGDPGLPSVTIASQSLPNNFSASNAPQVTAIAGGAGRVAAETHWTVTGSSPDFTWTVTTGAGDHQGYTHDGVSGRRWGTNRASDPSNSSSVFSGIVSNTVGVLPLSTPVGATVRDVISLITLYDSSGQTGTTQQEFQAIPGDSGGPVFYKRGAQWELAGIINAQLTFEDQPFGTAVYGNATTIAALSYYNQNYTNSIKNIIESHPDYSIPGDINLDGIVSGNGAGPPATDDVAAFVAGWGYNNGTGIGNIASWKSGDLTRDGRTDVNDFLKLRMALNGQVSAAVLTALFGGTVVPEPSAIVLAAVGALLLAVRPTRRGPAKS